MIRIGQEISVDGLKDCSFVTTTYKVGDVIAGRIGVIGPRRMAYSKVISHISFVKQTMNEHLRRLSRGEEIAEEKQTGNRASSKTNRLYPRRSSRTSSRKLRRKRLGSRRISRS